VESVLLSAMCGAAFVAGGGAMLLMIAFLASVKDKASRQEMVDYWKESLSNQRQQIGELAKIACVLEAVQKRTEEDLEPEE
jgi:hypothetical protein